MRVGIRVKQALGRSGVTIAIAGAFALIAPAGAMAGHFLLDHPAAPFGAASPPPAGFMSGGEGAEWDLIETISTGNPHTDLDFFTQGGNTYASVGTLGIGPNAGGQTIVKLAEGDQVTPETIGFVSAHPSASCLSNPAAATGLQHDVEASPKGNTILNTPNPSAVVSDTQLLLDASDAEGRCHDQGVLGIEEAPQGGLEIVDVTNVEEPVEIGLTSHIGESHTVNVDPKRPHIAYSVTSDAVGRSADDTDADGDGDTTELIRENEDPADADRFDLDGFEVVDFSSCLGFPAGATLDSKRAACSPAVYRYRYPTAEMALGHTLQDGANAIFGCHELELYPDDTLTCGSGNALIELDMSGAFDDMGTPTDFSDDKPRGTALPCKTRPSSSLPGFASGAMVVDCVDGTNDDAEVGGVSGTQDLTIPGWIAQGSPSLEGVEYKGSIYHQGRGAGGTASAFDSTKDIDFNHETELTGSGDYLIATDERGGGILPPGATCTPAGDNPIGNGGVHFYDRDGLSMQPAGTPEEAFDAYARTPDGEKAIFRATIRTQPRATVCTAHVFQQIPGENRIFMGWYSQGTQVIDFVENRDGTIRFVGAGHFIPANADEWVSQVFKTEQNPDGSTTYWGATGDFALGEAGRNSIDVYKVTLPPAPRVVEPGSGGGGGGGSGGGAGDCTLDDGGAKITGTAEGEKLFGSIASDRISGRKGNDKIKGREGNDCLRGNGGNDRLSGGSENDTLRGGGGKDKMKGNAGRDLLNGGRGADRLNGNGGADALTDRSGGKDRFSGGGGRDKLTSNKGGSDKVDCGPGRDTAIVDDADQTRRCEKVKVR